MSIRMEMEISDTFIKQKIAQLPEKMLEWAFEVLMKQAQVMKAYAQVYVPVDTGSLRDSIRVERGGEGQYWRRVSVRAGGYVTNPRTRRRVDYAIYVEHKQTFMRPAFEAIKPTIADMITAKVVEKANEQ